MLPDSIKPKHVVYVVYTKLGPHGVREDKDEAKAIKKDLEAQGHVATIRKYTLGKESVKRAY